MSVGVGGERLRGALGPWLYCEFQFSETLFSSEYWVQVRELQNEFGWILLYLKVHSIERIDLLIAHLHCLGLSQFSIWYKVLEQAVATLSINKATPMDHLLFKIPYHVIGSYLVNPYDNLFMQQIEAVQQHLLPKPLQALYSKLHFLPVRVLAFRLDWLIQLQHLGH